MSKLEIENPAQLTEQERIALIKILREKVDKNYLDALYRVAEKAREDGDTRSADEMVDSVLVYDWQVEHTSNSEMLEHDLTPDKAQVAKNMTKMGVRKAPTAYNFGQRKRKENPTKQAIVAELADFLKEKSENACESVEITNKEREISFEVGENKFTLTLVQKRKPKK